MKQVNMPYRDTMGEVDVLSTIVTTEMSTIEQSVACLQERKEIDHLRYQMVDQIASITTVRLFSI